MYMKKKIFLNWKSYLTIEQSSTLAEQLVAVQNDIADIVVFPTAAAVSQVAKTGITCGVQATFPYESGAYTGETTLQIVQEVGAQYALVGHSERRVYTGLTDEEVNTQAKALLAAGITPVICIGENAEQYDSGKRKDILQQQLEIGCKDLDLSKIILAYEPVWAISGFGGSHTATIEEINEVHVYLKTLCGDADTPILYGGSVHEDIDQAYLDSPVIQGFLIGSAGTNFESMQKLLQRL